MKKNLTKGERIFRIVFGALLILALYLPGRAHQGIIWAVSIVLIFTGILGYCGLSKLIDKK